MVRRLISTAVLLSSLFVAQAALPLEDTQGCTTRCGLFAPRADENSCKELQKLEDKALAEFQQAVTTWTRAKTCPVLFGWTVLIWPGADRDGAFNSPFDRAWVLGQTLLYRKLILVGLPKWGDSALVHELAHVISWTLEHDLTHDNWVERGICHAINFASDHFHCDYGKPSQGRLIR